MSTSISSLHFNNDRLDWGFNPVVLNIMPLAFSPANIKCYPFQTIYRHSDESFHNIIEPQNPWIEKFGVVQERRRTDFKAPKLWKGSSGSCQLPLLGMRSDFLLPNRTFSKFKELKKKNIVRQKWKNPSPKETVLEIKENRLLLKPQIMWVCVFKKILNI